MAFDKLTSALYSSLVFQVFIFIFPTAIPGALVLLPVAAGVAAYASLSRWPLVGLFSQVESTRLVNEATSSANQGYNKLLALKYAAITLSAGVFAQSLSTLVRLLRSVDPVLSDISEPWTIFWKAAVLLALMWGGASLAITLAHRLSVQAEYASRTKRKVVRYLSLLHLALGLGALGPLAIVYSAVSLALPLVRRSKWRWTSVDLGDRVFFWLLDSPMRSRNNFLFAYGTTIAIALALWTVGADWPNANRTLIAASIPLAVLAGFCIVIAVSVPARSVNTSLFSAVLWLTPVVGTVMLTIGVLVQIRLPLADLLIMVAVIVWAILSSPLHGLHPASFEYMLIPVVVILIESAHILLALVIGWNLLKAPIWERRSHNEFSRNWSRIWIWESAESILFMLVVCTGLSIIAVLTVQELVKFNVSMGIRPDVALGFSDPPMTFVRLIARAPLLLLPAVVISVIQMYLHVRTPKELRSREPDGNDFSGFIGAATSPSALTTVSHTGVHLFLVVTLSVVSVFTVALYTRSIIEDYSSFPSEMRSEITRVETLKSSEDLYLLALQSPMEWLRYRTLLKWVAAELGDPEGKFTANVYQSTLHALKDDPQPISESVEVLSTALGIKEQRCAEWIYENCFLEYEWESGELYESLFQDILLISINDYLRDELATSCC